MLSKFTQVHQPFYRPLLKRLPCVGAWHHLLVSLTTCCIMRVGAIFGSELTRVRGRMSTKKAKTARAVSTAAAPVTAFDANVIETLSLCGLILYISGTLEPEWA